QPVDLWAEMGETQMRLIQSGTEALLHEIVPGPDMPISPHLSSQPIYRWVGQQQALAGKQLRAAFKYLAGVIHGCAPKVNRAGHCTRGQQELKDGLPRTSAFPWLGPRRRLGLRWVIRPVMLGIAPFHVLLHLGITATPEPGQVLGHLHRSTRRGKQVQLQRYPALGDTRRFAAAEHLLQTHRQYRRLLAVVDTDT